MLKVKRRNSWWSSRECDEDTAGGVRDVDQVPGVEGKHLLGEEEADHGAESLRSTKVAEIYTSEVSQSHNRN